MKTKLTRKLPKSFFVGGLFIIIGVVAFVYYHRLLGITIGGLGSVLILFTIWLSHSVGLLVPAESKKEELQKYTKFATFYLKDRGLEYSDLTFEVALEKKWTDIVTMCLLLGIGKELSDAKCNKILRDVFWREDLPTFKVLLRAGFKGDLKTQGEEYLLFLAMQKEDGEYVKALLENGVSPNLENLLGQKAIFVAIEQERVGVIESLIEYKVSFNNVQQEGLSPMFFALTKGNFKVCEKIYDATYPPKVKEKKTFKVKRTDGEMNFEKETVALTKQEMLLSLIGTKNKEVWKILKEIFKENKSYQLSIRNGVELYARLSYVTGEYMLHTNTSKEPKQTYSKEQCHQDLAKKVIEKYRISSIGGYIVEKIYDEPKCIESTKEVCTECKGKAELACEECKSKGMIVCDVCEGEGNIDCSKCKGKGKISCYDLKEHAKCKTCNQGVHACQECNGKGEETCPACEGHGTKKCSCPPHKKVPCRHCEKGFKEIKNGQYVKCDKCTDGWVCSECNNTKWILSSKAKEKDLCTVCQGKKRIVCRSCGGKGKVKCAKPYVKKCDCTEGKEVCPSCEEKGKIKCPSCNGKGQQECKACANGFIYKNIYLDFKCKNFLAKETWFGEKEDISYTQGMSKDLIKDLLDGAGYSSEIFLMKKENISSGLIQSNYPLIEKQLKEFLNEKPKHDGLIEILETVPIPYYIITLQVKDRKWECVFVKEEFIACIKTQDRQSDQNLEVLEEQKNEKIEKEAVR
jgi:hypothetical protein